MDVLRSSLIRGRSFRALFRATMVTSSGSTLVFSHLMHANVSATRARNSWLDIAVVILGVPQ